MFVDAFSHRKVISQSPSKISQACGATKIKEGIQRGSARFGEHHFADFCSISVLAQNTPSQVLYELNIYFLE